jgi:hypothetical protein
VKTITSKFIPASVLALGLMAAGCGGQGERTENSRSGTKEFPVLYFDTARVLASSDPIIENGEIREPAGSDNSVHRAIHSPGQMQKLLSNAKGSGVYFEVHPNSLIIRGAVPSQVVRDGIVDIARKLGATEIIDRLETASNPRI